MLCVHAYFYMREVHQSLSSPLLPLHSPCHMVIVLKAGFTLSAGTVGLLLTQVLMQATMVHREDELLPVLSSARICLLGTQFSS